MFTACIVDDETLIQKSIIARLRTCGESVLASGCADNAEEALSLYWQVKPDIFFIDINMPGQDGLSFIRQIRSEDGRCATKFIILSGYDDFGHLREAIQIGVADYLKKPVATDEFNAVLSRTAKAIVEERRKNSPVLQDDRVRYYEDYADMPLKTGAAFAVWSPTSALFDEYENKFCGTQSAPQPFILRSIPRIRLYYTPGAPVPLHDLRRLPGMTVAACPVSDGLSFGRIASRLEQTLNLRFIRPDFFQSDDAGVIGDGSGVFSDAIIDTLDYAIDQGNTDSCHACVHELISRCTNERSVSEQREHLLEVSSVYRRVIVLLIEKYVKNHLAIPAVFRDELLLFALGSYDTLNTFELRLSGLVSETARLTGGTRMGNDFIREVTDYLHSHYGKPITLDGMADQFFVSAPYLSRHFREKTGVTFVQYLEDIRMEKAAEFLLYSSTPIADIGECTGYAEGAYFSKVFRKKYGCSPTEYRKNHPPLKPLNA